MNFEKLNVWLTLGANIGVIAGIVFLAIEVNQNNILLEEQAKHTLLENRNRVFIRVQEQPAFAAMVAKLVDGEALTSEEVIMQQAWYQELLLSWQWEYEQLLKGRFDEKQLPIKAWQNIMNGKNFLPSPGFREFLETREVVLSAEFYEFLQTL